MTSLLLLCFDIYYSVFVDNIRLGTTWPNEFVCSQALILENCPNIKQLTIKRFKFDRRQHCHNYCTYCTSMTHVILKRSITLVRLHPRTIRSAFCLVLSFLASYTKKTLKPYQNQSV